MDLETIAKKCPVYRAHIVEMISAAGSGHPGGSLSLVEIVCLLFNRHLQHSPRNPENPRRDRFVLSKGHGVPVLYTALADTGYLPPSELTDLRKLGSRLQGHPDRVRLPIVEASTGSLGQGLSVAQGMAMAQKLDGFSDARVYCVIGDGETQEGQIWETAMSAPKFKLDNLTVILDYNKGQIDGHTDDVMSLEPLADKWRAFNWDVRSVDGHNLQDLDRAFTETRKPTTAPGKPRMIIANTVKGKGVSFMENLIKWHGSAPNKEETAKALEEIKRGGFDSSVFGVRS